MQDEKKKDVEEKKTTEKFTEGEKKQRESEAEPVRRQDKDKPGFASPDED